MENGSEPLIAAHAETVVLSIRKWIVPMLIALAVVFTATYLVCISPCFNIYTSSTSFYINDAVLADLSIAKGTEKEMNVMSTIATNRALLILNSDELRDSIIRDFDLLHHYKIDDRDEFRYEKLYQTFSDRIRIRRDPVTANLVTLEVKDQDRFVAAKIANMMVARVNDMNNRILEEDVNQRVRRYEGVLHSLQNKSNGQRLDLKTFMDTIHPRFDAESGDLLLSWEQQLSASSLVGKLDRTSGKYDDVLEDYYNVIATLKAQGEQGWRSITVVKKATPDIASGTNSALITAFQFSGFALILLCMLLFYYLQHPDIFRLFRIMVSGKKPA
ncbi:MAG: hypothetical protein U0T73_11460 [Chitinophagales bacterium]